jgi:hypothetical protein
MVDEGGGDVDDVPASVFEHVGDRELGDPKEANQVDPHYRIELVHGVVGERASNEDPSVVDQRVDPSEAVHTRVDDAICRRWVGDITSNGEEIGVVGLDDGARVSNDGVAELAVGGNKAGPHTL